MIKMERKYVFLVLFALAAFQMVKPGVMPMFQVIQDELVVVKNELTEYITIETSMSDAGTLDAVLNMEIDVLKTLPSDFHVMLKLDRETSSGDFVSTGITVDQPYCEFIKYDKLLHPLISKFGNFATKCPIEAGHYYMRNVTLKGHQLPLAVPLGTYRIIFRYSLADKTVDLVWKGRFVKA